MKGGILVVDDDLSTRQTLSQLLEPEGYVVRCAPSGQMLVGHQIACRAGFGDWVRPHPPSTTKVE
jgi:CheY-like chemotaxis protein